jgi:hypothetical protein
MSSFVPFKAVKRKIDVFLQSNLQLLRTKDTRLL